jgi:hypothetical protein
LQVITLVTYTQFVFGTAVTLQIINGARVNRMSVHHQRRLNRIEALVFEYLATATVALPPIIRDRLMQTKKVAASIVEAVTIEERIAPARVMFLPANVGLLGTAASLVFTGLVAGFQNLQAFGASPTGRT